MGRIEIDVEGIVPNRRGTRFDVAEVKRLVQEVRERRDILYGTKGRSTQPHLVRQAWEEIAEIVSTVSNVDRSGNQCRKRFNDINRRRGQMMAFGRKRGRPPKNHSKEDGDAIESSKHVDPEDLEFEVQAPMDDDDPDYEPVPKKKDIVKIVLPKEESPGPVKVEHAQPKVIPKPIAKSPATPSHTTTPSSTGSPSTVPPKPKITIVRKPAGSSLKARLEQEQEDEKHPFLELQKAGFDMLKRELSLFRDSVMSLNTRLNHLEVALRPVGYIGDSLSRIATAVERLTCPPE